MTDKMISAERASATLRRRSFSLWVCGALGILGALLSPRSLPAAHVTDRIVAVVNNELITLSELKSEIASEEKRIQEQYQGAERQRRLQQVGYMGLTRMIERKLQMQLAKSKGVEISDADVQRAMRELQRQGEKVDEANPNDQKGIKEQLILLRVVEREVRSGVMVSEQDMRRYYQGHQRRFSLPEEYRISQILIVPKSYETAADARARAESVSTALKQGGILQSWCSSTQTDLSRPEAATLDSSGRVSCFPRLNGPWRRCNPARSASRSRARKVTISSGWMKRRLPNSGPLPR